MGVAESILDRVRALRIEMRELEELNIRYRKRRYRHTPAEVVSHERRCARMGEIKAELATILDKFAGAKPKSSI